MENKFHQICNKINYNTYQNIQSGVSATSFWTIVASILTEQYPMLSNSLEVVATTSLLTYLGMIYSNGKIHTKDITEIKAFYQEFIVNYNQMNRDFGFNNPIQIHTMFNYLLYEGYLSKGKEFQFSGEQARDIMTIYGTNIIMGKGVCRHISSMLKDILNDYGMGAFNLGCYTRSYNVNINMTQEQKYSYEELKMWVKNHITDERTNEFLNALIEELQKQEKYAELSYEREEEKNFIKKMCGNHVICFTRYDNVDYYLDSTQDRIYRFDSESNTLYDNEEDSDMKIRQVSSLLCNSSKEYLKLGEMLKNPNQSISLEEEQKLVQETKKLCKQNMDIFEQFYHDNSELYDEISNRLIKIKKNQFASKVR